MTSPTHPRHPGPAPRPTALITGASSGIGRDLAHILAEHNHDLILVARTQPALATLAAELERTHHITATVIPSDLSDPAAPQALYDTITARALPVDILVNNAGFGGRGPVADTPLRTDLDMIQVNVSALTALTKLFLPAMIARNRGRILNVASTAAFQPGPLMAVYYASKAYVLSFTEAVADELRNTNVTATTLCPGPTHTNFAAAAHLGDVPLFARRFVMSSRDVAEQGYDGMMRGARCVIPGFRNRLVAFGTRFVPRRTAAAVARRLQEER